LIVGVLCFLLIVVTGLLIQRIWKQPLSPLDKFWSELAAHSDRVFIVMPVIGSDNIKETDAPMPGLGEHQGGVPIPFPCSDFV